MGRILNFLVKRKTSAVLVMLALAGAGYWVASSNPPARAVDSGEFQTLETCLERSDYACVARAAYKAMPFDQAKRRNHQIGMALAFAGDTDLAMATLKAEREYWRKTRIAGAIIARHIVSDAGGDIPLVMNQLDSLVQQTTSLQQAGSFLSSADKSTFEQFRQYVVSFVNESIISGDEAELLRVDTKANSFALGNVIEALRLEHEPAYKEVAAGFSSESVRGKALQVIENIKAGNHKHIVHKAISVAHNGGTHGEITNLIRDAMESERARRNKAFPGESIRILMLEVAKRNDQIAAKVISPAIEAIAETVEQASCQAYLYNRLAKMNARVGATDEALRLIDKSLRLDLELLDSSGLSCAGGGSAYTHALAAVLGKPGALSDLEKKVSDTSASGKSKTAKDAGRSLLFSLRFMSAKTPFNVRSKIADISVALQELDGRTKAGKAELFTIGLMEGNADVPVWFKLARSAQRKYAAHDKDFPRRLNRPLLEAMTNGYAMSEGWLNLVDQDSGS